MDLLSGLTIGGYHRKAEGPNQHVIGSVERGLIEAAVAEIGRPEEWPATKRDKHHILEQGRSLILRDHRHRDTEMRRRFPTVEAIVALVTGLGLGEVPGKIVVAYLPPHKVIKPHRDSGEYYKFHNRIHVPLITSEDVVMTVDGEDFRMSVGNIYLFQNLRRHAARNGGTGGRIHLILDLLDPRYSATFYRKMHLVLAANLFFVGSLYRLTRYYAVERGSQQVQH